MSKLSAAVTVRHPLSGRGRTHRSCAVPLRGLQTSRRAAVWSAGRCMQRCGQGDEGAAQNLPVLGAWPAALLRQLRHGPLLHNADVLPGVIDIQSATYDDPMPFRSGAYPGRRAASLDGACARTAHLRPLSPQT